ncbi:hypothetical protein [Methanothermococcus okinawensis]|uniref:HEAT domain containing protein n=1 Tax=Methanothermococcus okinawensis (strain DSM 14208 / JCM 11175 / IH1) TaxID=647113 RepID=F8AJR5_METOI|nr:hypothetical protein [Methanothermococcus okinawensis]AEH07263.1 HEAT domain containing protein [Methanothermococcus okinawensis IH1]
MNVNLGLLHFDIHGKSFKILGDSIMTIPFFRSKSSKLKKLIEEGRLHEARKFVENDISLMDSLMGFINSNNPKIVSNSIYLTTKIFLKHNKNIEQLMPYIKKGLKSDNEDLILNTLISLKGILAHKPEYFNMVEKELTEINEKYINLQIREHTWELLKKYGKTTTDVEIETRQKTYEKIKQLMRSAKQESLIKRLFNTGLSLLNLDKINKLNITKEKINSSISKKDLKGTLELMKNENIEKLSPLNIAYCLSTLSTLNEKELNGVIENVLKLLFSENDIVRHMALNAVYEVSKRYPDIIYKNIDTLTKHGRLYGESTLYILVLKEISKKYDLRKIVRVPR